MTIEKVVNNGYCIGCGSCSIASGENTIQFDNVIYQAKLFGDQSIATRVCPFSDDALDETSLASKFFDLNYDDKIGYYDQLLALRVKDPKVALNSSSGGGITWLLSKLFTLDKIDAVINVSLTDNGDYQYSVCNTKDELDKTTKSKYYPVTLDSIKDIIKNNSHKRFAITGVPCFIKAVSLLEENKVVSKFEYKIALFCGHYKSKSFSEFFAWQAGVPASNLAQVDFRVKNPKNPANQYFFEAKDKSGNRELVKVANLYGSSWGYGFFKSKACEYCDDICGELADITFGDAWLDKYTKNPLGTNIVVSRNKELTDLILSSNELFVEKETIENVFLTQAGNYRHRRGGAITRKRLFSQQWTPKIREALCDEFYDETKTDLFKARFELLLKSQSYFILAKKLNSLLFFKCMMSIPLFKYIIIHMGIRRGVVYTIKSLVKEFIFLFKKR